MALLPINEKNISKSLGRKVKSPILVTKLEALGIDPEQFLEYFKPLSAELAWDPYDVRRLQVAYLVKAFPKDKVILESRLPDYYVGKKDKRAYRKWIMQLTKQQKAVFEAIQPWRRRSVSKFILTEGKRGIRIKRVKVPQFTQEVDSGDVRSLARVFQESPAKHVEHELFYTLMKEVFKIVQDARNKIGKTVKKLSMTAHFMSVKATSAKAGDNSPEGAHEDGADYIVSALVLQRYNLKGGQTQMTYPKTRRVSFSSRYQR